MKNIPININRPELSRQEIDARKNFDAVMQQYTQQAPPPPAKAWYQHPWAWGGFSGIAITAALIAYVVLSSDLQHTGAEENVVLANDGGKASFISAPLKGLDVPFATYTVDGCKGGTLDYKTGTVLHIPANAFKDAEGQVVCGPVEVKYREMHDVVDFFLSGIPMEYDSAGTRYTFESAGMAQIFAYKDGKAVFANQDSKIQVQMASAYAGSKYNVYELDTVKRNWVYRGKDEVTVPENGGEVSIRPQLYNKNNSLNLEPEDQFGFSSLSINTSAIQKVEVEIKEIRQEITVIQKSKPEKPAQAKGGHIFTLDVDFNEFPEMKAYKNVEFEVPADNQEFRTDDYKVTWEDVKLAKADNGMYTMTLIKGKAERVYPVKPVFRGNNYAEAIKEYDNKFANYEKRLDERKAEEKRMEEEYQRLLAEEKANRIKQQEEANARMLEQQKKWKEQNEKFAEQQRKQKERGFENASKQLQASNNATNTTNTITRAFYVSGFGTWNCDHPTIAPSGASIAVKFTNTNGEEIELASLYLTSNQINSIYLVRSRKKVNYNPNYRTMLWGVTQDNQIAVCRYDDFDKCVIEKNGRMPMEVHPNDFKDDNAVKQFLQLVSTQ